MYLCVQQIDFIIQTVLKNIIHFALISIYLAVMIPEDLMAIPELAQRLGCHNLISSAENI